jgi:hypothetical protein
MAAGQRLPISPGRKNWTETPGINEFTKGGRARTGTDEAQENPAPPERSDAAADTGAKPDGQASQSANAPTHHAGAPQAGAANAADPGSGAAAASPAAASDPAAAWSAQAGAAPNAASTPDDASAARATGTNSGPGGPQPGPSLRPQSPLGEPWPWQRPEVSPDRVKICNFRLPETLDEKLTVAARRCGLSKKDFVARALDAQIQAVFEREGIPFDDGDRRGSR